MARFLILFLVGCLVALSQIPPEMKTEPDSEFYRHAARTFAAGQGFHNLPDASKYGQWYPDNAPLTQWPPLYPVLLVVFDPELINVLALGALLVGLCHAQSILPSS